MKMDVVTSEEIDILRGFAALGVIVGHTLATKFFVLDGAFWVWIFFVISGFLQAEAFFRNKYTLDFQGIRKYYFNRCLRIIPLFWLILLIAWTSILMSGQRLDVILMVREFFFLTKDYSLGGGVGPLWTIACEMHFYLCMPLIMYLFRKDNIWILLPIVLFSIYLSPVLLDNPNQPRMLVGNLPLFFLGIVAAYFSLVQFKMNAYFKFTILLLAVYGALWVESRNPVYFWQNWGIWIASFVAFYMLLFQSKRTFLHALLSPIRFVGKYCYGVYMYSALIAALCYAFFGMTTGFLAFSLQLLAIPLAYLSYRFFEQYFLRFKIT